MTGGDKKKDRVLSIIPADWDIAENILEKLEKTGWEWRCRGKYGKKTNSKNGKIRSFAYYLRNLDNVETKHQRCKPNLFRKRL